jgi:hypothetical protein
VRRDETSDPDPVLLPFSLRSLDKKAIPTRPILEDFVLSALARRPLTSSRRRAFASGGRGSRFLPSFSGAGRVEATASFVSGYGSDPGGVPRYPRSPPRLARRRPGLPPWSAVCPHCSSREARSCSPRSPILPSLSSPPSPCVVSAAAAPCPAPPDLAGVDFLVLRGVEVVGPLALIQLVLDSLGPSSFPTAQWWARPRSLLALTFLTLLNPQSLTVPGPILPLRPARQPIAPWSVDALAALLIGGGCQLGRSLCN